MQRDPFEALRQCVMAQAGPARAWHQNNLHHHERRYRQDLALVEALAPEGSVLEIGSAPCHMTAALQLAGFDVVGIDVDPARVAPLIREFALDVRRCDIEREPLPFDDQTFACALLCETFEHLRVDPAFVLSEIHRVLLPGAPLLLTTPNVYSLPSLGRFLLGRSVADPAEEFGKLRRIGHMGHVREYSAREVLRFLAASGFVPQTLDYRSSDTARSWKRRLLALAYRIGPRWLRRDVVVVARRDGPGPRLAPLLPLSSLPPLP